MSRKVLLTIYGIHAFQLNGVDYVAGTVQKEGFPDREVSVESEIRWIRLGYLDQNYLGEIGQALERVYEGVSDLAIFTGDLGAGGKSG